MIRPSGHKRSSRSCGVLFLSGPIFGTLMFIGCPQKPVQPKFIQTAMILPPHSTPRAVDATPPDLDFPVGLSAPVMVLSIPPPKVPPMRHVPTVGEPEPEVKPEAPQISPQLTPAEKNEAQGGAETDLRAAQQSLDATSGRRLNANQQDLADKINGFIKQAREAMAAEDWIRARSLAQKAKVLGDQLTHSF